MSRPVVVSAGLLLGCLLASCAGDRDSGAPPPPNTKPVPPPPPPPAPVCQLDEAFADDPGWVPLRRLSRYELARTYRVLFDEPGDFAARLPPDDIAHGFDNLGEVQRITPAFFSAYFDAVIDVADETLYLAPSQIDINVEAEEANAYSPWGGRVDRRDGNIPPGYIWFVGEGWVPTPYVELAVGTYEVRITGYGRVRELPDPVDVRIRAGGAQVDQFVVENEEPEEIVRQITIPRMFDRIEVGFVNRHSNAQQLRRLASDCADCAGVDRLCSADQCYALDVCATDDDCTAPYRCFGDTNGAPPGLWCALPARSRNFYLDKFTVRGPLEAPPANSRRDRWVTCEPSSAPDDACGREILGALTHRAWRRPATSLELDRLTTLVNSADADDFNEGLRTALYAVLLSPHFLFRVEADDGETPRLLTDYELATRLSYFLWSEPPDETLLDLAAQGALGGVLAEQVDRMLEDPRADALVESFGTQWLGLRPLTEHAIQRTPELYPEYDDALGVAMATETQSFLRSFLSGTKPISELMTANYGWVDRRLAEHYGLDANGREYGVFERTDMTGANRGGGILTQASLLTVTGKPSRTSIVKRGEWVLSHLLCAPPPPPPDSVEGFPEELDASATLRERMEQHRANPVCRGCHESMDNIGFGLEGYGATGRFRTTDEHGLELDTRGTIPGGASFESAAELGAILAQDRLFHRCVMKHFATFATGRGYSSGERCDIEALVDEAGAGEGAFTDYIHAITNSNAFSMRRAEEGSN